jgi:microsomal dipeptidase-like Zn-dependent dipeptidase
MTALQIIEHIDHAVKIAGVDHVGLVSDFDAPRCRWVWKTRRNCRRSPTRC